MKFIKGVLFDDVKLQMEAKLYSELYNKNDPPKPIDIMQICIIRIQNFQEKGKEEYLQMEHFIEGEYKKFNSNSGYVSEDCRRTPQARDKPTRNGLSTDLTVRGSLSQAFSHFSFEQSGREKMIIDIQGDFEIDFGKVFCDRIFRSQ